AMDAPDRQVHALAVERLLPGQHVLVDAVDEGAVEVEQEGGGRAWHGRLLVVGVRARRSRACLPGCREGACEPSPLRARSSQRRPAALSPTAGGGRMDQ